MPETTETNNAPSLTVANTSHESSRPTAQFKIAASELSRGSREPRASLVSAYTTTTETGVIVARLNMYSYNNSRRSYACQIKDTGNDKSEYY